MLTKPRICKFCQDHVKDGIDMVRSVATGDWICMPCFNERIKQ